MCRGGDGELHEAEGSARRSICGEGREPSKRTADPGLSAAIVSNGRVIWSNGFGFQDVERNIRASPHTLYRVESLTKPLASTVLLQLVGEGKVNLEEPISRYSREIPDSSVTIRHILTHTSRTSPPGEGYRYDGARFSLLTSVLEGASGQSFRELLATRILGPLAMTSTLPGEDVLEPDAHGVPGLSTDQLAAYGPLLLRKARPYVLYAGEELVPIHDSPGGISTAAGLVTTVGDLAKFDAAVDGFRLLPPNLQESSFLNAEPSAGAALPYALGWFVQPYRDGRLIWHYGYSGEYSGLYLKVPARSLTLIVLASSGGASAAFDLGLGDVRTSPFACAFLRMYIEGDGRDSRACEAAAQAAAEKWLAAERMRRRDAITLPDEVLDRYVGDYEVSPGVVLTMSRSSLGLTMRFGKYFRDELFPETSNRFFRKTQNIQIEFVVNSSGRVTGLTYNGEASGTARRLR
jgi:CubicO group peptidase (beta-lactamase class C family)